MQDYLQEPDPARPPGRRRGRDRPRSWSSGAEPPDLVITDIRMPDMDGIEAAEAIYAVEPVPIIIVSAFHDAEHRSPGPKKDHILAYLVKPIKQADLEPAITIAMTRFQQFQAIRQETDDLRQALEDRKLIERAKGILMKQADRRGRSLPPAAEARQRQEPQAHRDRADDPVRGARFWTCPASQCRSFADSKKIVTFP